MKQRGEIIVTSTPEDREAFLKLAYLHGEKIAAFDAEGQEVDMRSVLWGRFEACAPGTAITSLLHEKEMTIHWKGSDKALHYVKFSEDFFNEHNIRSAELYRVLVLYGSIPYMLNPMNNNVLEYQILGDSTPNLASKSFYTFAKSAELVLGERLRREQGERASKAFLATGL